MTRYSFIRVTRSFVFPSLFNHFLGCSLTALNAQNQKMLGNKETRIRTRYTHTDKREDSEKDRCWNHVRGVFKSRNSNMLNIFFITFSRVSLLFLFHFLIFFFLFSLFFCTCICILSTSYFFLFFRLFHFTLPAHRCHRREILTTLSSRHNSFSPLPSPKVVLFAVKKMDDLTSFPNTI